MNVFIDTNVFLSFYHFTSDDLEELKKLRVLLKDEKVRLLLPDQVVFEFNRNRDSKIDDALKRLKDHKLIHQFPQFCKDYDEYEKIRSLQDDSKRALADLIQKAEEDIGAAKLKADDVIRGLFDAADTLPTTDELYHRARRRTDIGNPPGDKGSVCDRLIWEHLLESVPDGQDLHIVTADGHFASALDATSLSSFLVQEWQENKHADGILYTSLTPFFRKHFPDISLASELQKDLQIGRLANSGSFAETHAVVAELDQLGDFSTQQINAIIAAAISNNQVYWIIHDPDVHEFLLSVAEAKSDDSQAANLAQLLHLLGVATETEAQ